MVTKLPRINTVLDESSYRAVEALANRDHVSLSQKVRDLVRYGLEVMEDIVLDEFARGRRKSFNRSKALTSESLRKRLGLG